MAEIDSNVKLYVKEEAEKARTHVLSLFTIIASIIALITGIGVYLGTQANIKQAMQDGDFARLLQESEQKNSEINTLHQEAEALVKEIQQSQHLRIRSGECYITGENHTLRLKDGDKWEPRSENINITFEGEPFNSIPKVVVGVSVISANADKRDIAFEVSANDINERGFTCTMKVWSSTSFGAIKATWVAYEQ